jgi:hypothetical protein
VFTGYSGGQKMKKFTIIVFGLLLLWFTLDMSGLAFSDFILVESAVTSEPIDIAWYLIFIACFACFIWKEKVGKYAMPIFLIIWGFIQYPLYIFHTQEGLVRYNNFFQDTHHIIAPSNTVLIKDTYHIVLDILILLSFVCAIVFIVRQRTESRGRFF